MNKKYALVLAVLVVVVGTVAYASAYMTSSLMGASYTGNQVSAPAYGGNANQAPGSYQANPSTGATQTTSPDSGQSTPPPAVSQSTTPPVSQPQTYDVKIQSYAFAPSMLTIKVGDTVRWTNYDSVGHTVVSDSFSSPTLSNGNTYEHMYSTPGTYTYRCSIHPSMQGTIIVH
jgi:plastocyanin